MSTLTRTEATIRSFVVTAWARRYDDRGEGVISTALSVLIVAFLGVAAYVVFKGLLDDSGNAARNQIKNYGG
jgi:hypothetical protein